MKKLLIYNCNQLVTPEGNKLKKGSEMDGLNITEKTSIYIEDGIIKKVGPNEELLAKLGFTSIKELPLDITLVDATDSAVLPGFIDSHTHFVFGGYREKEFMKRLSGVSYLEIMKAGGGIQSTVNETRKSSFETLFKSGYSRLNNMLAQGVTTVEGKSGYGLDYEVEIRQLKVMKALNNEHPIDIVSTYMGAHAVPLEYKNNAREYLKLMIDDVMPKIIKENLAEFCDVFCEEQAFNVNESKELLEAAKDMGFKIKLHSDEINDLGGTQLGIEINATSLDHLLMISESSTKKLAESSTVATILPCTAFCLNKEFSPAKSLIEAGCGVALATDFNPGSCFTSSIPLMLSLAVMKMGMTLNEVITAITLNGAAAVDKAETIGTIEIGKKADIILLSYPDYRFLIYNTAENIVKSVIKNGEVVYEKRDDYEYRNN